jgi:GT2 family glycosyltransferase/SAM-dependent methyltransferase
MEFTGERYLPDVRGQIKYEHLHRYALSLDFVVGKTVLDLATGEGYGAALLAQVAESVTGVDIDSAAVEHARLKHYHPKLNFLLGKCESVPLPDASVDVVTSFETIEHHDNHEGMMLEIKRVLKPGGVLILSSPNRLTYSDEPGYSNPFHVKELYYDELRDLVTRHFKHLRLYGQKLGAGSFIFPLRDEPASSFKAFTGNADQINRQVSRLSSPIYFVVVCSDDSAIEKQELSSIYLDYKDDLLKNLEAERIEQVNQLQDQLQSSLDALAQARSTSETQARHQADELLQAQAKYDALVSQISDYEEQLVRQADEMSKVRSSYEAQLLQQEDALSDARAQLSVYAGQLEQQTALLSDAQLKLLKRGEILRRVQMSRSWQTTFDLQRARQTLYQVRQFNQKVLRKLNLPGQDAFYGHIDSPEKAGRVSKYLKVSGWVFSKASTIVRVEVFLDNVSLGTAQYGLARPDVVAANSGHVPQGCGYSGGFQVDELLMGRRTLMIRVWDARGNVKDYLQPLFIDNLDHQTIAESGMDLIPEMFTGAFSEIETQISPDHLPASKRFLTSMAKISLHSFLSSNATIEIPQHESPAISIILVLYNRAELTLQCLYSILKSNAKSFEIIIVDNASTDETGRLLKRIKGAQIIENQTNVHYLLGCNQAAKRARGEFILLLNNDTQILADSINSALETIRSAPDIGAVGGKIVLPDGTLQEAGSIIWQDGSCLGYGRGDSPLTPSYTFKRDVDYCSAAFLLTRRDLFLEDGGFDEDYAPAYYEETDYCVRLWKKGKRVVYDPNVVILHYEFASSTSQQSVLNHVMTNQKTFISKNQDWLSTQHSHSQENILEARTSKRRGGKRILFIDDRVPHINLGSGFPRSNRILSEMVEMGHFVTLYPLNYPQEDWASVYQDIPQEVEVLLNHGLSRLEEILNERADYYDLIFVSRPHNMAALDPLLSKMPRIRRSSRIVYDAEALFSLREIEQLRVEGKEPSWEEKRRRIDAEVSLAGNCSCIVSVSERESDVFLDHGFKCVHTLGHSLVTTPTLNSFDERRDILFVGAMHSATSPNTDSMIWFHEEIFPLIRKTLGQNIKLTIAGPASQTLKNHFNNGSVRMLGKVDDLTSLYERARIFIAPTRFSAGIPHKVHEAAAHGLPVVATSLTGMQLGWNHEEELLLADDAAGFAAACVRLYQDSTLWNRLRQNGLNRVRRDCSPEMFTQRLKDIIG